MGLKEVQDYFQSRGIQNEIILLNESSATVELAAKALNREPGEIAKTMALQLKDGTNIVIVIMGTARIDNRKYKDCFGCKAKMLSFDDTLAITGHPVGGVCPFGLPEGIKVYLDKSLKKYETVFPAAGTPNSAVGFSIADLEAAIDGTWIDVCKEEEQE
ncbi:MAG: YbaK/EbsC family protein [Bacillota bacterium]|nr:YbaK/EbsC family protein [Bacillota bacterium]